MRNVSVQDTSPTCTAFGWQSGLGWTKGFDETSPRPNSIYSIEYSISLSHPIVLVKCQSYVFVWSIQLGHTICLARESLPCTYLSVPAGSIKYVLELVAGQIPV